jgi:hypothetical protein
MRTLVIIVGGFVLLGVCLLAARFMGGADDAAMVTAAKVFIPIWLVVAGVNMYMGVSGAGYSVAEELPIFLAIFALPAAAASVVWWKFAQ